MATRETRPVKKKGRTGAVVALLALVAAGAWFLKDFGFGPGAGTGEVERTPPAGPPPAPPNDASEVRVVVEGADCLDPGGQPQDCAEACRRLADEHPGARIVINARSGTHGTVEALERCLTGAGAKDVRIVGGPGSE